MGVQRDNGKSGRHQNLAKGQMEMQEVARIQIWCFGINPSG